MFPSNSSQADIATYYLAGIVAGIFDFQAAKDWAYSIVEELDTPSIEIIEVAAANDREIMIAALSVVCAEANNQVAGRWLLADLYQQLASGNITPMQATHLAMKVVSVTSLSRDIWYDFDSLADELQLSVNGTFSTAAEIGRDILSALMQHSGAT